jgi:hypothetical protein
MISRIVFLIFLLASLVGADTPTQAALRFAEALRDDRPKVEIQPLCCLNPNTGEIKKNNIARSWQEHGEEMLDAPFVVVEEKIEEVHAAVVLSQRVVGSAKKFRVWSFALVRDADAWKPAPVLSSFENSLVDYSARVTEKRKGLVRWMLAREFEASEALAKEVIREFELAMRQTITPEQLKTVAPQALVDGFLQAVRDRNPAAAIARLGGYNENPSSDLTNLHEHIIRCFSSSETMRQWPWNLITDAQSILAPGEVTVNRDVHQISILAIHPDSLFDEPQILTFDVSRKGSTFWQLKLPEFFTKSDVTEEEEGDTLNSQQKNLVDGLKKFVKEKRQLQPKDLYASAEGYSKYISECLTDHDFLRFWVAAVPEDIFTQDGEVPAIGELWQQLQEGTSSSLFALLASKREKKFLLAVLQSYSPGKGMQIQNLWFQETREAQWELLFDEPEDVPAELLDWAAKNEKVWKKTLTLALTEKAQRIGALANASLDLAEIRSGFEKWQKAMDAQSLREVIPFCASFQDEKSILAMLRNIARDIVHDVGKKTVLQVHQSGRWGAVSGRIDYPKNNGKPAFPLYIFVATDAGPRMLPQIDYRVVPDNTTRDFLNKYALGALKKIVPEQTVAELEPIIEAHRKLVAEQPLIPSAASSPSPQPKAP